MQVKKKIYMLTSVLLAVSMLTTMLPFTVYAGGAQTPPQDTWHSYAADSFAGGDGSETEPYVINTAEQLAKLSKDVMEGNTYKDMYFVMMADINLSAHRWIPIGVHKWTADSTTVNKPFSGSFDGNEKTVSGMYIDSALDGDYYTGLFGNISNYQATASPVIKDLTVTDADVVYNVQNQMDGISGIFVGRIAGNETPQVKFSNITVSDSTLKNDADVLYGVQSGAFAGYNDYALVQDCHTKNITITGGGNIGGFVGCTAVARYESCTAGGSISGEWGLGGFVGNAMDHASFTKCIADVDVTADNWNAGGFCGYAVYGAEFDKCVAYGDVKSTVTAFEPKSGGFAGTLGKVYIPDVLEEASSMTNCYFVGTLTSAHETIKPSGLVALLEESTVTDCAYDGELNTDLVGYEGETAQTALPTNEIKAEICEIVFEGHDMSNNICTRCGYETYGIFVHNTEVSSLNAADVLGAADEGATVTYDAAAKKLTLNNAAISIPSSTSRKAGIYIDDFSDALEIELTGTNSITLTSTDAQYNGIWNDTTADLKISGTGTLDIALYSSGSPFGVWNRNSNLTFENCGIKVSLADGSATNGFLTDCAHSITVDGAKIEAEDFLQGLFAETSVTVKNGAEVDITATETVVYSDGDVVIEGNSTVDASVTDAAAICSWGDITITDSVVTAESVYDNGIYCFGKLSVSGGNVSVKSTDFDALQGFGGIKIDNNAVVLAESISGVGIYTGEILDIASGTVTAKGASKAIAARRISDNASGDTPTDSAAAITLAGNLTEESGAIIKTDDWTYTQVWDPIAWDNVDKWVSGSYFVDSADVAVAAVKIIAKPQRPQGGSLGGGIIRYTVKFDTDGGTGLANVSVIKNAKLAEPTAPQKDGYSFAGWFADAELTTAYDFDAQVSGNITLYAKWEKHDDENKDDNTDNDTHNCPSSAFDDLDVTAWYHTDTDYVIGNNIFKGTGEKIFEPNTAQTRAMMVTVLYRAEGEPAVNRSIPFADVDLNAYYANAVIWAKQNGVVSGYSESEFGPDDKITREQIAAIMHRYAGLKGYDVSVGENTNILSYTDFESISEYAIGAVQWAAGSGLLKGKTEGTLNPQDNATRAEIAAVLHRFIEANK